MQWQSMIVKRMLMGPCPVVENHQDDADVDGAPPSGGKPSIDALLSAESARLPLAIALLQVTGDVPLRWHTAGNLDACAGERARLEHHASCLPKSAARSLHSHGSQPVSRCPCPAGRS